MNTIAKIETGMVGGAVVGFVVLALVGHHLQSQGTLKDPAALARFTFPWMMALFASLGLGLIGLGLHFFIIMQGGIGNGGLAPISFLRRSETGVTLGVWAFLLTGLAMGYPFMKRDMLGAPAPKLPPSQGLLVADIGQRIADVRGVSTLTLAETRRIPLDRSTRTIGDAVFDFSIAGSHVRFPNCRYYFITTGPGAERRIDSMNIGISPFKRPRSELEADEAHVREQLQSDGWQPESGTAERPMERSRMPTDGQATTGDTRRWVKGGTQLILSSRRMDEARAGEDPKAAGEYILYLDLRPADR